MTEKLLKAGRYLMLLWFQPSLYEKEIAVGSPIANMPRNQGLSRLCWLFAVFSIMSWLGSLAWDNYTENLDALPGWLGHIGGLLVGFSDTVMLAVLATLSGGKLHNLLKTIFCIILAMIIFLPENMRLLSFSEGAFQCTLLFTIYSGFYPNRQIVLMSIVQGAVAGMIFIAQDGYFVGGIVTAGYFIVFLRIPNFIFNTIWSWRCNYKLAKNPSSAPTLWRQYPLMWDEVIWLPLPGARKFLAGLVRYDRDFGFDRIAFVAAERGLQARATAGALEEVAFGDLSITEVSQLSEIPRRLGWLRSAAPTISADLCGMVPFFVRVAEFYKQSRTVQSNFRKRETIESCLGELDNLRKKLIGLPGHIGARLIQEANNWNSLLQTEMNRLAVAAREEREIPQVFRFGNPVREDEHYVFAGRQDIIRQLENLLVGDSHPPAVLLHGARRMGKTSILYQLPRLLGPKFITCFLDCQMPAIRESAARFFFELAGALDSALEDRTLAIPKLSLVNLVAEPFGVFNDWLVEAEGKLPAQLKIFICFDEYEALNETLAAGWGGKLLDYLRHLQQHRNRFVFIFTGVKTFHSLGRDWNSRFVGTRLSRVSFLTLDEFRPMLESPVPGFNLRYAKGVLEELVEQTHGQPFLTQAVAKELVDLLNDEKRHEASLRDLAEAIQRAMRSAEEYFNNVWSDIPPQERTILTDLVNGHNILPGINCNTLREMDLLDKEGRITMPLFRRWMQSTICHESPPQNTNQQTVV